MANLAQCITSGVRATVPTAAQIGSALGAAIGIGIGSLSSTALAAYSNYNSILIGERAAGLGGAFTALSGDPAATPYYNPATTVLLDGTSLSATVNVYNKYETSMGESGDFTEAPQRINRGFFRSLPASSATVVNFQSFAVGLSILVPDYDYFSGQVKGAENTNSLLNQVDESLWVGGTFSARLTEKDSLGLSLYYTARNLTRSVHDELRAEDGSGATLTTEEKNLSANSVVAIFGYHRRLTPTWSIGISYRPPSLPISGDASYFKSTTQTTPYDSDVINRGDLRAISRIPSRLTVGVAREVTGKNTLSLDLQFSEGLSYQDLPEFETGSDFIQHRSLVNFALGFEQAIRDWITFRIGLFSNLSSHPSPDASRGVRQADHVDMTGFSSNITFQTNEKTTFTFGGYYVGGSGETTQIIGNQLRVIPKSQQVFTMLIATGFHF